MGFKANIAYGTVLQEFVLGFLHFLHAVGFYSKSVPSLALCFQPRSRPNLIGEKTQSMLLS